MRFNVHDLEKWDSSSPGRFDLESVRGKELRCTLVLLHSEPAYMLCCDEDQSILSRPMHWGAAVLLCGVLNSMPDDDSDELDFYEIGEAYERDYYRFCYERKNEAEFACQDVAEELRDAGVPLLDRDRHPRMVAAEAVRLHAVKALRQAGRHLYRVTGGWYSARF